MKKFNYAKLVTKIVPRLGTVLLTMLFMFGHAECYGSSSSTYHARIKVYSSPSGAGSVYVKRTTNGTSYGNEDNNSSTESKSFTWYLYTSSSDNEHYRFLGWKEKNSSTIGEKADGYEVKFDGGETEVVKEYTAHYAEKYYFRATVTVDAACAGMGNVSASYSSGDAPSWGSSATKTTEVWGASSSATNASASLYVKAQPADGYEFVGWYVDGSATAASTAEDYNFSYTSSAKTSGDAVTKNVVAKFKVQGEKLTTAIGLMYNNIGYDGSEEIEIDIDNTFSIQMENAPSPTGFAITQISTVDEGEAEPVLTYSSGNQTLYANRAGRATFRIEQAATEDVTGKDVTFTINVNKRTPVWEYTAGVLYENTNVSNPIHITDGRAEWTLTSANAALLSNASEGTVISNTSSTIKTWYLNNHQTQHVTCTFHQDENYKYKEVTENIDIALEKKLNHVPISGINAANIDQLKSSIDHGGLSSTKNGYELTPEEWNYYLGSSWTPGKVVVRFEGIPDKLSCKLTGAKSAKWTIEQSANNSVWEEVKQVVPTASVTTISNEQLKPQTKYLRFSYTESTTKGTVSDLVISELHFSSSPDFVLCRVGEESKPVKIYSANVEQISHSFTANSDKFNVDVDLVTAGFDSYAEGEATFTTTATTLTKTKWQLNYTQAGGAQGQSVVDVHACPYPASLPMDIKNSPYDYYYFKVDGSDKESGYEYSNKKITFNTGSSTGIRKVEFCFADVAGDLSFKPNSKVDEGSYWNIYERASAEAAWELARKSYLVNSELISVPLKPETRHVKIEFSGSKNDASLTELKITKGVYIRSNKQMVSFVSEGATSTTCTLTTANVNNISVSMANGANSNYTAALGGNTLTITRTGNVAEYLYDQVIISGTSAVNGATVTKRIPVNMVPATITSYNANSTGIKTGTVNNPTTEWAWQAYKTTDVNVSGAFAGLSAFCDKLYIFDKTYNETNPHNGAITTQITSGAALNNLAMTSCHVYTKSGDDYVYEKTIENVCSATKNTEFDKVSTGGLKLYFTGFCPMMSCGYTLSEESAIYMKGNGGTSVDVYLDNCFITPRVKTIEGYGDETVGCSTYPEGTAAVLCFENANNSGTFTANVHFKGRNMLRGMYGITYLYMDHLCTHQSAPIMVKITSTSSKTILNMDDKWPVSIETGDTEHTNGQVALFKRSDNCSSIDLGNKNTTLNFNGGQYILKNAYPGSTSYTTTMAISYRSYMGLVYGMGNDQTDATVNFNDGTFNSLPADKYGTSSGSSQFDSYYRDPAGNPDGTSMRCPQNTYINGGTFNCNIFSCEEVTSAGGSPINQYGDAVCMMNVRSTGTDGNGFAVFDFPYNKTSNVDNTKTLADYYADKQEYGHASMAPSGEEDDLYVHLFVPCEFADYDEALDYSIDIWKYALPSMTMSGSNASMAAQALGVSGNDLGGPTTVNTVENFTNNILWGKLDAYMREASADYVVEDEIGGKPLEGVLVHLGNEDYSYVANEDEYTIRYGQYILQAVTADYWVSLCPPFDVKNIYVVESYPEHLLTDIVDEQGRQIALLKQGYTNIDYCYLLAKAALYSMQDFASVNTSFKSKGYKQDKEQNNYTGSQGAYNWRGVKKITPYVDFQLYENKQEWSVDENDNFTCDWETADNSDGVWMEKGRNYILQFPAKTEHDNWDYWTGKMIIFEGTGSETIQGTNAHATIKTFDALLGEGKAVMLGNTTLAEMTVNHPQLYSYNEETGMFIANPDDDVKIQPAQGFLYVNPSVDPEAPVELFGIEAHSGKGWYFLSYGGDEIMVERSAEAKTYKGLGLNADGTENNRYIYRNAAWVELTDEDGDHAWLGSNSNTYIYYAGAWVIVTKINGLYTDGSGNKYYYDNSLEAWVILTVNCGVYTYETNTFLLINDELVSVSLNTNDAAYYVLGSDPAIYYLDADGSCTWIQVTANSDGAYYDAGLNFYVYFDDAWVSVERIMDNPNWNHTYIDASSNYYISNSGNWLKITGPDENHLWHGSDMQTYIYFGDPADWVAVTHHEGDVYTDGETFYQYNTTTNKWETVVVDIVVKSGEDYTVSGALVLNDLTVEATGEVIVNTGNSLRVHDLVIESTPDNNQSGIVHGTGIDNFVVEGEAYLDITMNSTGEMDASVYYSFAVPFTVNRANGVQRLNKNTGEWETATFGANYLAYEYDEYERATNGPSNACWKRVTSEQYVPGKFYLCEFDNNNYNVYRFKANDKSQLNPMTDIAVTKSSDDAVNAGWNGIAGKGISYTALNGSFGLMFALNSAENAFNVELAHNATLAVGHAVFVQATAAGSVTINQTSPSAAPARVRQTEAPLHCIRITESGKQKYDDQLFISASEEALPEYVAGKDVQKPWMGTPKVARIWIEDYNGLRLAANEAVIVNDQADCQLGISAPKKGEYVLALQEAYDDVTVYLTHNGIIVANLTLGEYPISVEKGETAEYGLRIVVHKAPNVATDFDAAIVDNPNGVHKVMIDDVIYIIKDQHVYTTNGQLIK